MLAERSSLDRVQARYLRLPSDHLGRRVHLWTYGWWGRPVVVFPSASGMAHEWQMAGAIDALAPLIQAGRIKLYCPESNASETWTSDNPPAYQVARHRAYEQFITEELTSWIRDDCDSPRIRLDAIGVSLGGFYAANAALKYPELFRHALCLSGRYDVERFAEGWWSEDLYFQAPYAYVPNLDGEALARVRRHTSLTLVIGQGPFEGACLPETLRLASVLRQRDIPHELDVWGHDSAHHWDWWKRQLRHHLSRRY
ncbi:MAG: esterase [Deltaproteobacteria bacterium]|nr:MAG: esterase [Deltaproteobacteria bacterium]